MTGVQTCALPIFSVVGCGALLVIGMAPPHELNQGIVGGTIALLTLAWWGGERRRFPGPPDAIMRMHGKAKPDS